MNYLYRCLGSHADAEDLVLMVFEEVWRLAPRYRAGGTFGAWLFALARGRVRHEWRRRSRHPVTPVAPGELTEPADPSGDARAVFEVEEALLYALRDLPAKQRDALLLSVHSTLTTPEAARSMGIRADYFHVLVNRARAALKRALSP